MENVYYIEETNNGWNIYFKDYYNKRSFISGKLSRKQAQKWCDRLNKAYRNGICSQY